MGSKNIRVMVGGRFHADQMVQALQQAGHQTKLLTSFPASRFPMLSSDKIESFIWPEIIFRLSQKVGLGDWGDKQKMRLLGRYFSRRVAGSIEPPPDLLISWSSFGLELMKNKFATTQVLMRDSSHILHQTEVLEKAYSNLGLKFSKRSFCIERELEEYKSADAIFVLSQYARDTFLKKGVSESKVHVLPLGVDTHRFQPTREYQPSLPLKLVYFGSLSVRKGIPSLLEAVREFSPKLIRLTLIGAIEPALRPFLKASPNLDIVPPLPQAELAKKISDYDVFVCPTLEDGFGQVVIQAMASGLVPITTDQCGAGDCIESGKNGYLIPAGDTRALIGVLTRLVDGVEALYSLREEALKVRDQYRWDRYGQRLQQLVEQVMEPAHAA